MQKRKRVGSLAEYFAYLAQKGTLESVRRVLAFSGTLLAVCAMFGGWATLICLLDFNSGLLFLLPFTLLAGFGAWGMFKGTLEAEAACQKLEPVAPPTRQNIEQLPAEEMLVRASQEPTEGQEKVLLRAATAVEEVRPEELLRASE